MTRTTLFRFTVCCLAWLWLAGPVSAQPEPSTASPPSETVPAEDDGWDFEDDDWDFEDEEEEVETWATLLRDQAPDIAWFTGFATLALIGFFKKSVPLKYVTLGAAVVYMGFTKSQLISVVNIYGLMTGNMPVFRYSIAWYLFAIFTVATTILWARHGSSTVCSL